MPKILLLVEDVAQEKTLSALLHRIAAERGVSVQIQVRTARGGISRVKAQLRELASDLRRERVPRPDGVVVAIDANCKGYLERRKLLEPEVNPYADIVVYAIPDPHIERWLLLDSHAFKTAVGRGCKAPDEKCEKQRYKKLLNESVRDAGVQPLLGGIEYAEDIVAAYQIQKVADADRSFGQFLSEYRSWLNRFGVH